MRPVTEAGARAVRISYAEFVVPSKQRRRYGGEAQPQGALPVLVTSLHADVDSLLYGDWSVAEGQGVLEGILLSLCVPAARHERQLRAITALEMKRSEASFTFSDM